MEIVFEDSQVLVCRKEAGLAVQSGRVGAPDLVSMLKNRLWEREGKEPYLGVVHRLDQPVEGLLVFAKTKKAAASLSAQVQDGRMVKQYLAVTLPEKEEIPVQGRLEDWLLQDRASNSSRIVPKETRGARKAVLEYRILKTWNVPGGEKESRAALAQIRLFTGRHHQIRVQMAGAGMPLAGDRKYGSGNFGKGDFPALCAWSLAFIHPGTGKEMAFQCQPEGRYFPAGGA